MSTLRPEVCVGAVVLQFGRLLLIERASPPGEGQWSLPGGRVERGELMVEAVVREVREETGLDVVCGELVGWVERISADHHFVIFDFAATSLGGELQAGSDAANAAWVSLDEVSDLAVVDGLIEFLVDHDILDTIA